MAYQQEITQIGSNFQLDETNLEIDENKYSSRKLCFLIKRYIKDFYGYIYIPYDYFKRDDWDIHKTLNDNEDMLFYNQEFVDKNDKDRFYEVFDKFTELLGEIFSIDGNLCNCLYNFPSIRELKINKNSTESFLFALFNSRKYFYISPAYKLQLYYKYSDKCDGEELVGKILEKLNTIISSVKKEMKVFANIYENIITSYVYEKPFEQEKQNSYVKGFVNSILLEIIELSDKLIKLHVYGIHTLINEVIEYYLPMDEYNNFDSEKHDGRKIVIV
ncbi:hypothetical protein QJ850_gp661 [Acanthamoeba polyphaga mimivirus]|uniref:Uncharacterized protein n=1 Tax=Acanthamoeba polyphaga mimivirus Kroon TaxID=3069720 RepID=A0A0G2Y2R6_9VIRU|nr:hypothetical protein QJ850_gp661 [Acanthamoeba polyphaga mimivirus]AKI80038.1 hypothetical protein [Acanthamoeba polyphaga mimivirus Kroon]